MRCPGVFAAHLGTDGQGLAADAALFAAATHNNCGAISGAVAFTAMLAELLVMEGPPEPAWWLNRYVELAASLEGETCYEGRGAPAARGYQGPIWRVAADRVQAALSVGRPASDACDWCAAHKAGVGADRLLSDVLARSRSERLRTRATSGGGRGGGNAVSAVSQTCRACSRVVQISWG